MLKFLRIFSLVFLSVLAAASLAGLVLWKTEGMRFYSVQTGSMAPLLQSGDLAITVKADPKTLQVGDIVSYASPQDHSIIITHRIYRLEPSKGFLVTKGDNLNTVDPPTTFSSVTGKTVKVVPKLGYGLNFLHKPAGLIGFIYLPALIISASELSRLMRYFESTAYGIKAPSS